MAERPGVTGVIAGFLAGAASKPEDFNLSVTFHPPDARRRDLDNAVAAFKAGQDGLADAWGVDDSAFHFHYAFGASVKHGTVVVTDEEDV